MPKIAKSPKKAAANTAVVEGNRDDAQYDAFLGWLQARFLANLERGPLFTTDADGLFAAYLAAFQVENRQHHTCHACRRFIERFGGLVTINEQGRTESALWHADDADGLYAAAIAAMAQLVRKAKVTGVFLASETVWGQPLTGVWRHMAVTPPAARVFARSTQTAGQAMAEKREDFKTVNVALGEFALPVIERALSLLETDALYRSEKVTGPTTWLRDLHVARDAAKGQARANVVWRAIALAPAGFCHPRSSMIGTLLEDIAAGMDFADVSARFKAKMHPLLYQRPQAAPSAGNIAAAEKLIEQIGAARSLERRFARLDEIQTIWTPAAPKADAPAGGVFGHLRPKGAGGELPPMTVPAGAMTWVKFAEAVLPTAEQIEVYVGAGPASYSAFLTAVHADAPPIFQWDREEQRNPVSWYVWHGGSAPSQWGLASGRFHPLTAISLNPSHWYGARSNHADGVLLVIDGARETRFDGLAIFPECLRSELHGVRSTIEAFSRRGQLAGAEQASACGLLLGKGGKWNTRVRVTAGSRSVKYTLDRWD